uniref:Uncharacterized protein n=1 Tax=Arundo donax TaxID=35708 RepID=A0A0A9GP83_ARUDO
MLLLPKCNFSDTKIQIRHARWPLYLETTRTSQYKSLRSRPHATSQEATHWSCSHTFKKSLREGMPGAWIHWLTPSHPFRQGPRYGQAAFTDVFKFAEYLMET